MQVDKKYVDSIMKLNIFGTKYTAYRTIDGFVKIEGSTFVIILLSIETFQKWIRVALVNMYNNQYDIKLESKICDMSIEHNSLFQKISYKSNNANHAEDVAKKFSDYVCSCTDLIDVWTNICSIENK